MAVAVPLWGALDGRAWQHLPPALPKSPDLMGSLRAPTLVSLAMGRMRAHSYFLSKTPHLKHTLCMFLSRTLGLAFWVPQDLSFILQLEEGAPTHLCQDLLLVPAGLGQWNALLSSYVKQNILHVPYLPCS